jgi:signal transduction histidine kinase
LRAALRENIILIIAIIIITLSKWKINIMSQELDFDELVAEISERFDQETSYWLERLLHDHVANPVMGLFTSTEIIQRALDRKPEMVPDEVATLRKQLSIASENIRKIVRALVAAFPEEVEDEDEY